MPTIDFLFYPEQSRVPFQHESHEVHTKKEAVIDRQRVIKSP